MTGTISLLDPEGLRHEIDIETWVSYCAEWVVTGMDGHCGGKAVRYANTQSWMPVNVLGSHRTQYVANTSSVVDVERPFGESDEPITCLSCVGAD